MILPPFFYPCSKRAFSKETSIDVLEKTEVMAERNRENGEA